MNTHLPKGWIWCSLADLAKTVTSGSRDWSKYYAQSGAYFVRSAEINDYRFRLEEAIRVALPRSVEGKRTRIEKGDILVTITGANVGKCAKADHDVSEAYVSQSVALAKISSPELTPFIYYSLRAPSIGGRQMSDLAYGVGRPVLSLPQIRGLQIPLAPLAEQHRIVARLEGLLAKVDACQQRLSKIPLLIKRFRQAVLAAACSGRLTADWREASAQQQLHPPAISNPDGLATVEEIVEAPDAWNWVPLQALCDPDRSICYGVIKLGPEAKDGIPCLRTSDVKPLCIDRANVKRIAPAISHEYSRTVLTGGEVLVNVRGTLGGVAVVPNALRGWNVSREVAVVPVKSVVAGFVTFWIASPPCQNWLNAVAKGVAYTGINISDLKLLPVALPSVPEQREIVRRVGNLFALADQIETRFQTARAQVDKLTSSLLASAFSGQLVPQDPNDEPAEKLLERIRAGTHGEPATCTSRGV